MIELNTFAAACYEQNSMSELLEALENGPDATDMKEWGLSESEWKEQIQLAIDELYKDKRWVIDPSLER